VDRRLHPGQRPQRHALRWRDQQAADAGRTAQARDLRSFSKTYGCKTLVWYEKHTTIIEAIRREKQIKRWRRDWKLALIVAENPEWRDLSDCWFEVPDGPLSWMQRP
jgi:hypothetical protein